MVRSHLRFAALACGALALALVPRPAAAAAFESDVRALQVGHWVDAAGALAADGSFVAEEVEVAAPEDGGVLVGTIDSDRSDPRRFALLGRAVTTSSETEWRKVDPTRLAGVRVKVEGVLANDGGVIAETVSKRGAGRDHVGGRVDGIEERGGRRVARVFGFDVVLPASVEHELPLAELALAPAARPKRLPTANDEDDLFGEGIALGRAARLTGQLELEAARDDELDLDLGDDEDEEVLQSSARVRLDWQPVAASFSGRVEGRGSYDRTDSQADGRTTKSDARLGEAWLAWEPTGRDLRLVAGRQDFDDEREWIYDENLDALRLFAGGERVRFELSASTTLSDGSPRDEEATNFVAVVANADRRRRLAAWVVHRDFDLLVEERTTHLGVRAAGRWLPASESWLDVALFRGERGAVELEGWGFDVGATWRPEPLAPFAFTVGYAFGSGGGDAESARARTFRQTGFQDNNGRFGGVTSFRYYGELLEPELANLAVLTAGIGVRFARRSSLDLVWHRYEQDEAADELLDTELDRDPDGEHTELGWEADLIFGSRERPWYDLEIVVAYFEPGAAFPDDAPEATLGRVQVRFRF